MKTVLPEWYGPSEEDLGKFLSEATIALDANVLLALYRVGGPQRQQLLKVLHQVSGQLWVPYQAALEYQRRRLTVAASQHQMYQTIESIGAEKFDEAIDAVVIALDGLKKKATEGLRDKEISTVVARGFDQTIARIKEVAQSRRAEMKEEFEEIRKTHAIDFATVRADDPIRAELDSMLTHGHVGEQPDAAKLTEWKDRARDRIEKKIPPGYMDADKPDPSGDCIIWFELIEWAKMTKKPVLFITDDVKEDFYDRVHGQTVGPRPELRQEMLELSGQQYHQTTIDGFLRMANNYLQASVPEDTIDQYQARRGDIVFQTNRISPEELLRLLIEDGKLKDIRTDGVDDPEALNALGDRIIQIAETRGLASDPDDTRLHLIARSRRREALQAHRRGESDEAITILENLLRRQLRAFSDTSPEPMITRYAIAEILADTGNYQAARRLASRAMTECIENHGVESALTKKWMDFYQKLTPQRQVATPLPEDPTDD
ncbi:PIN-like domain-containing protein [Nocardia vulneris]|uniref:PIN-like domain-containing protein n=1 Tax=Nocardia vulneris TaxID=1141657 RepID=UPI000AE37BFA|nr:PIN-like domain-containing protein [Nocardia vulneris]